MKKKALPVTKKFFEERVKINKRNEYFKLYSNKDCMGIETPDLSDIDADLIIIVTSSEKPDEDWLAWAGMCYGSYHNLRPIIGRLEVN